MQSKLHSLFCEQGGCINLNDYQNEFETMRLLFDKMPELPRKFCGILSLQWLQSLEEDENLEFSLKDNDEKINESKYLREQGNKLFTAKEEQRNILGACRLYNDAIFAALDTCNSNELALGFANRALALQTFGYYQQAYDDSVCALNLGYPDLMKHKIITRQAHCALKLKDIDLMKKHLNELQQLKLSNNFQKQCKDLQKAFEELQEEMVNNEKQLNIELPLNRETQEIITTTSERGRYMQATGFIGKNQLIFSERASAIVAVGDTRRLCHQCGTVNFIPLPCLHCRGRVVYCSLKCKENHNYIHVYECQAYRFQLFAHVGIAHLALRIILDNGLMSILDELKAEKKENTLDVWQALQEGGEIWSNNKIAYAESLRMVSHFDKVALMDIEWFALVSHHLVIYLKNYTTYFVKLNKYNNSIDWELLTASLILRHIGQSISNAHTLTTIIPRPLAYFVETDFRMLHDKIWSSPWRVKRGYLHNFSYYDDVACLNLPYLSLCNHSCVQSFQPKFSGRYASIFALRDFNKGDEITNCFVMDYRKAKRSSRCKSLENTYHFVCQCENCIHPELEDVEFNKHHQYRCDNPQCRQIFVPNIPHKPTLNWWQSDHPNGTIDAIINCTVCGCEQRFEWYHECKRLMYKVMEPGARRRMYQIFQNLENNLLGLNDARQYIAMKMIHEWFQLPYINIPISDQDYCEIIIMLEYALNVIKSESSTNSVEYICEMTFLWDLLAKRKYKCSSSIMGEMLAALNVIADDLKVVFLNYYNDYIKDIIF